MGSCDENLNDLIAQEAHRVIDQVIESARSKLYLNEDILLGKNQVNSDDESASDDMEWFNGEEFTLAFAESKIEQFVQTWKRDSSWLYCIDFIGEEDFPYDKRYRFRVRWSIPTRRKPIPRATASVYFTIVISTVKPKSFPVDVYYIFEGNQLVHRPGKSKFKQCWLKDIIESKVLVMQDVRF